jgi:hypothetical protein
MHWLDRAARLSAARTPSKKRPFNLGWGDRDVVQWYRDNARVVPPIADIEVRFRPARRSGDVLVRDLEFESPFEMLPEPARRVRARWITTHPEPERVVVLHASWNDEDYRTRTRMARDLLARGIAAVIPQHPLYGDRRRAEHLQTPVPVVSDFCLMGRGGVLEGRSLIRHLHDSGYRVGVSGYSMGGNIAGFVGVLVDFPVAISATAVPYSAGPPFMSGLLRSTIAWEALGGETPEVVERISKVLHAGSLLDHPPPPHAAHAVLLAGTRDGFVPTSSTQAIHRHWPGSRMHWVNAGHASLLFTRRDLIVGTVVESFDRLDAARQAGAP